ncbi:Hypothetical predicted protein [Cloeon dipterum]|uniref:Protein krueppel n=1 Tax=Cloeon dipterum TaxID=197152 RepID=A0A8S1D3K6_9INSE|nr:Hypothetical predicted protein [Cloeon dipterum]
MGPKDGGAAPRLCRLCGKKKPKHDDVSSKEGLIDLVEDCLKIKIDHKDGLPQNVCNECGRKLRSWRKFFDTAQETQLTLVEMMPECVERPERHKCALCGQQFSKSRAFAQHLAEHSGRKFCCPVCKRNLASEEGLVRHQEVHSDTRNHCCHHCGRLFQTLTCLSQHVRYQHRPAENPAFTCQFCNKNFVQRTHFEIHVRTHTGIKPYCCETCGSRFPSSALLQRHVYGVHEKKKRYKCPQCPKEFLYKHNYTAHLARHEGTKEVKCDQCDKSFFTRNALFRHMRVHSKDKPFACDICGKKFADCSNRKRHMQQQHGTSEIPRAQPKEPEMMLVALSATDEDLDLNTLSSAPLSPSLTLPLELLPASPLQLPASEFLIPLNNY